MPYIVAEINEPDPSCSPDMKAGYREIERALERRARPAAAQATTAAGRVVRLAGGLCAGATRFHRVLELQERFGGRRILITGSGGSIGRALASLLDGFRPEQVTLLDGHEASLIADRRARNAAALERVSHVLCDVRDGGRLRAEIERARPDVIFHLAAYKHVDWAEVFPEEFVDTNLQGSWNVLRAAEAAGVETVVVASTDKAALAASFYGETKRFMEQLTAFSARSAGGQRIAVRLRQRARQRRQRLRALPATGARRRAADRHRHRHGPLLDHDGARRARARRTRAAGRRRRRASRPADPGELTVGELAAADLARGRPRGGPPTWTWSASAAARR